MIYNKDHFSNVDLYNKYINSITDYNILTTEEISKAMILNRIDVFMLKLIITYV